ncbi:MAG: hypothetical protein GY910_22020 [bacterium]|nr:hypothetical protein [bacterium]
MNALLVSGDLLASYAIIDCESSNPFMVDPQYSKVYSDGHGAHLTANI